MKIKKGFAKREIAGSFIVVPVGNKSLEFNGMITLNESGSFFWDCLLEDTTIDKVVEAVMQEYDAPEDLIRADVERFVDMLAKNNLLDE